MLPRALVGVTRRHSFHFRKFITGGRRRKKNRGAEDVDAFFEGVESGDPRRGCSSTRVVLGKGGRSIDDGQPRDTVVVICSEDVVSDLL